MFYHSQCSHLQSLFTVVNLVQKAIDKFPRIILHHCVVTSQDFVVVLDTTGSVVVGDDANLLEQSVEDGIKNGL